ncbi:hypothetical protein V5799_026383 [Amblyomma americanum]|uniref:Acyl-coa synthetase n=1 Tax=Amblyomma americanum TaxID=6943 RepID=A0AAQ4DIR0_AMBAM
MSGQKRTCPLRRLVVLLPLTDWRLDCSYKNEGLRKGDVFLAYLPLMHSGPIWVLFTALTHHLQVVMLAATDLASLLAPIIKYKVTTLVLYPTHGQHLVQRGLPASLDVSSVQYIFIAGSSIPPQILRQLAQLFSKCIIIHGDTGYYTARGELYMLDRLKDLIKCMDQQVAPAELEELLQEHPDVAQAAVTGVPHAEYGEAPIAFVVLKSQPATEDERRAKTLALTAYIKSEWVRHRGVAGDGFLA